MPNKQQFSVKYLYVHLKTENVCGMTHWFLTIPKSSLPLFARPPPLLLHRTSLRGLTLSRALGTEPRPPAASPPSPPPPQPHSPALPLWNRKKITGLLDTSTLYRPTYCTAWHSWKIKQSEPFSTFLPQIVISTIPAISVYLNAFFSSIFFFCDRFK